MHLNLWLYGRCSSRNVSDWKFSKLDLIVHLSPIKRLNRFTNMASDMLLDIFREMVPNGKEWLPESFYAIKKIVDDFGLLYRRLMHGRMSICFIGVKQ